MFDISFVCERDDISSIGGFSLEGKLTFMLEVTREAGSIGRGVSTVSDPGPRCRCDSVTVRSRTKPYCYCTKDPS